MYDDQDKQSQNNSDTNPSSQEGSTASLQGREDAAANFVAGANQDDALEKIQVGLNEKTNTPEFQEGAKDFFKGDGPPQGFLAKAKFAGKNKGLIAGAGGGVLGLILAIGALFGFINSFTLDGLMTNIEAKSFIRFQVAMDGRSTKWVQAYMTVRLSEDLNDLDADGNPRPAVFKAEGVDRNKPLTDWYRTLRSSSFEKDVFNKHGIVFASSRDPNTGKFRAVKLTLNGEDVLAGLTDEERDNIRNGRINQISPELRERIFNMETFDDDRAARASLRQTIRDDTRWWQAVKRRHIRQDIQNTTGIRDWRFFEKTRDKLDEKKIDIRNKIITKAFPDNNKAGKVVQCLFGIQPVNQCRGGRDPSNPENRAATPPTLAEGEQDGTPINEGENEDGSTRSSSGNVSTELAEQIIKTFIPFAKAVDAVGTLDMISASVSAAGSIGNLVTSYKAAQAIGFFTVFTTARDQIKTGELTGEEFGEFMNLANNISSNEGYATVIAENKPTASAAAEQLQNAKNKEEFCNPKYQEALKDPANASRVNDIYIYNCPEKQLGGVTGAASSIQAFMDTPAGKVITAIANAWNKVSDNIFADVIRSVSDVVSKIFSSAISAALKAVGLSDDLEKATQWAIQKIASAAGLNSLVDDTATPITGQYVNAIVQGGAATAENSSRGQGAALSTQQTRIESSTAVAQYLQEDIDNQSLFTKYASLSNPNSFSTKALLSLGQNKNKLAALPAKTSSSIMSLFSFSRPSFAAASPYAASEFAGIETFDFPKQCTDADPLTATPQSSTNIQAVLPGKVTDEELTWDLVTNKNSFYDFMYQKIGIPDVGSGKTAEDIAVTIYNCALLDNAARGGLGALYGYEKDGGLRAGVANESGGDTAGAVGGEVDNKELGPFVFPLATTQSAIKNMKELNWCWEKKDVTCHGTESSGYFASDIFAPVGTPVVSVVAGTVTRVNNSSGFQLTVTVTGNDCGGGALTCEGEGSIYFYAHMKSGSQKVKVGQKVTPGTPLGLVGDRSNTGNGSLQHLHFDVTSREKGFRPVGCSRATISLCASSGLFNVQPALHESFLKLPQ